MTLPSIIAIDGTAASGKSTIAQRLATRLDYLYFDTGVMYRAVTLAALGAGVPIHDEAAVTALAERTQIDVVPATAADGRPYTVRSDGHDVTWDILSKEVDGAVSPVSVYPGVRRVLTGEMRRIGRRGRVVMVGRDIGTVVLPEADLKLYLDATVETRAHRRCRERQARGETPTYAETLAAMRERDRIDSGRATAPLRPADDAVVIDTTPLDVDGVMAAVERLIFE